MKIFGICLLLIATSLSASPLPDFPFVTVKGESTRKVEPNEAKLTFQLVTYDKEAKKAKDSLNTTAQAVVKLLADFNVPTTSIETYKVDKEIKRERDKQYNNLSILGYEFSQSFKVSLTDLSVFPSLYDALLKLNNVAGINSRFDVSTREDIEVELIAEAGKNAKRKAEQMAKGLGVHIDSVYALNDGGSFSDFFGTFGLQGRETYAQLRRRPPPPFPAVFIPQFIEISKSVNVIYKLEE